MARKRRSNTTPVEDYRHDAATRKNNPPARLAAEGTVPVLPKAAYSYSPRLPPALRFDTTGAADRLPALLEEATHRALYDRGGPHSRRRPAPTGAVAGVGRQARACPASPWTRSPSTFTSASAPRPSSPRLPARMSSASLFGDPEQDYREAVQFYQHDVDWSNRLILGDSLLVMSSLVLGKRLVSGQFGYQLCPQNASHWPRSLQKRARR